MEESIANTWLQDSTPLVKTELVDLVSFQESEPIGLQLSSMDDFTPIIPSSLLGATAEHYNAYFSGCYQGLAPQEPPSVSCVTAVTSEASSMMSQALEQLLICKDTENQSAWGMQPQGSDLAEEPLHQLPGWIYEHDDDVMGNWPQTSNSRCIEAASSFALKPELPLSAPWTMMAMPVGSCISPKLEILPPVKQSPLHSGMVRSELAHPESPLQSSGSSNDVADANRKAAARKNRILLRQKSASQQRGGATTCAGDVNGGAVSLRALKKRYSPEVQREFLMCNHLQGRDMDLRFLLHKVLQPSDVNNLGRIVISKREAETHLPYLATKEGIFLTMEDFDTAEQWTFRYRFWPNSRSRMYLLESTGGFVRAHHLKKGDIFILWRNSSRGTFVIRGMEALPCWRTSNCNKQ